MPFTNQSLIQFLILLLLFLTCTRFIFLTRVKEDTLTILPFVALVISTGNVFVFGASVQNLVLVALSFFVSIINVRALLRLSSSLVIDHYGIPFIVSSVIFLAMIIFAAVKIIEYTPYKADAKKYEVDVSVEKYCGDFKKGFSEVTVPFEKVSLVIYKVEPNKKRTYKTNEKVILFVPPLTAKFSTYEAFFYKLARDGWTVYCGEFFNSELDFTGDIRDFKFVRPDYYFIKKYFKPQEYSKLVNVKKHVFVREYRELVKLCGVTDENFVVAVTDELSQFADVVEMNHLVDKAVNLNIFDSYKTPGFGPVENTDFFAAECLGVQKDRGFFMSNYLAQMVENYVQK